MNKLAKFLFFMLFIFITYNSFSARTRQEIVKELFNSVEGWMGTPYIYGGNTKKGIDCSAFVLRVYKKVFNKNLPRTVKQQKHLGTFVKGPLQPGDLIFFKIGGTVSHIGIYVFDGKFIHAASAGPKVGVVKSSLKEKYYKERYVYAKRLVKLPAYKPVKSQNETVTQKNNTTTTYEKSSLSSSNINDSNPLLAFELGNILYRGKIIESDTFGVEKPIFFKIINKTNELQNFYIDFKNLETNKIKRIRYFNFKKHKQEYKKMFLKKGEYQVKIIHNKKMISGKLIKVL